MALDPEFARPAFESLNDSPEWIQEDIAAQEEQIRCDEESIARNRLEINRIERENLDRQLDIATAKIKIYKLQTKLAAKIRGAL